MNATPSELVSAVAHELQAPIAAVKASSRALLGGNELDPETRRRLLAVISDAAEQLGRLAEDLMLVSHLGSEAFRVETVPCDAVPVAGGVVESARAAAPADRSLTLSATDGLPLVLADPGRLRQVLVNLVENAVKHSREGGLVDVRLSESGGIVRITVSDEGPGIPEQEQGRIFDRFQRGSTEAPGSGLGLYISRELVTAMGGTIHVESEPGRGARFVVELPRA